MRVVALLAALAAVAAPAALAGRAAGPDPSVAVVALRPVVVRGEHFRPGERVLVVFAAGAGLRAEPPRWRYRRVEADEEGRFAVRFRDVAVPRCTSYRAQARGSLGSRAYYERDLRCSAGRRSRQS